MVKGDFVPGSELLIWCDDLAEHVTILSYGKLRRPNVYNTFLIQKSSSVKYFQVQIYSEHRVLHVVTSVLFHFGFLYIYC